MQPLARLSREAPTARGWELLGCMYGFLGKWELVGSCMTSAQALEPGWYIAHYHGSVACRMRSDAAGAARLCTRFLAECPRDCRKRVNALYALAKSEAVKGMLDGGRVDVCRLRKLLRQAQACEAKLEPLWGPFNLTEKTLVAAMDGGWTCRPKPDSERPGTQ